MQKALIQMNLHLHKVISDVTGLTGMKIIKAIVAGEQDPQILASFKDPHIKSSTADIAASLTGDYRREHLFVLQQELTRYKSHCSDRLIYILIQQRQDLDPKQPTAVTLLGLRLVI
jgi:hypothetical protein